MLIQDVEATDRRIPGPQGARHPPRDRRLRDGLLVAELPAPVPDRHPQDRSVVRRQPRRQQRLGGARPFDPQPQLDAAARDRRRGHRDVGAARGPAGPRRRSAARATCSPARCAPTISATCSRATRRRARRRVPAAPDEPVASGDGRPVAGRAGHPTIQPTTNHRRRGSQMPSRSAARSHGRRSGHSPRPAAARRSS